MIYKINSFQILFLILLLCGCGQKHTHHFGDNDIDTLNVVTLYGPTSYFLYRGEEMGIDYENVRRFAEEQGLNLKIKTAHNIEELIKMLKEGEAQLAAYPVPFIAEYNSEIIHCGPKEVNWQVLVQKISDTIINDVTGLIGKDVFIEKNSKYQYRLENLNEELGGGINIHPIDNDTISTEDLLELVNAGEIGLAVVDSDIAALHAKEYPQLDTSVHLSLDQASSWAVAPGEEKLGELIDQWGKTYHDSQFIKDIYKRYYDIEKNDLKDPNLNYFINKRSNPSQKISPYDAIFKKYSKESGYDWNLLAAIAFCESRYMPDIQSRFGATGVMQVMPSSAQAVGVDPALLTHPDANIRASVKILRQMEKSLEKLVPDKNERIKFLLASYNSGLGHVYDAIALAEKNGLNKEKWTGNVGVAMLMKSRPEYFNDPAVKHGYLRGRETVDFVDKVMSIYNYLTKTT